MMKRLGRKRPDSKSFVAPIPIEAVDDYSRSRSHSFEERDRYPTLFERPVLSPEILFQLQAACTLIVKETGPSDEDYEAIVNQPDPLEQYNRAHYQKEQNDIRNVREQASASQTSLPTFLNSSTARKRDSRHLVEDPKAANRKSRGGKSKEDPSVTKRHHSKPLPPAQNNEFPDRSSSKLPHPYPVQSLPDQHEQRSSMPQQRAGPHPHLAEPARNGPSNVKPETRNPDGSDRPELNSRRMESHASNAPMLADELHPTLRETESRTSEAHPNPRRISNSHDYELRQEREKRISSINPDYTLIPTLHPTTYRPPQPYQPPPRESNRPPSRTSEILGSIRDGIRNYVQPRPSLASTRAGSRFGSRFGSRLGSRDASRQVSRPESRSGSRSSSRPASRGSMFGSGRNWLGLRRRGSFSSFRSAADEDELEQERGRDKGLDLNRSLPPLPGLDQWKEPKMHIAMLARESQVAEAHSPTVAAHPDQRALNDPARLQPQEMSALRSGEITTDNASPDIGPTPPTKSDPRPPPDRRSSKLERRLRSDAGPEENLRSPVIENIGAVIDPSRQSDKKDRKKSKAEKKLSGSEKKSSSAKSPTERSPTLKIFGSKKLLGRAEPAPDASKNTPLAKTTEESSHQPALSAPTGQSHQISTIQPTPQKRKPVLVRSSSEAAKMRIPFAGDADSAPASRILSVMEPEYIAKEVQRRLKDGKLSSPLSPATEASEFSAEKRSNFSKHGSLEYKDIDASTRSAQQAGYPHANEKSHPHPILSDRGDSPLPDTSEARSLAALGVDRVERATMSPRVLARGDHARAASAVGHYDGQRQALQPRESLIREWESKDVRTREVVGAGALVGLENSRARGSGRGASHPPGFYPNRRSVSSPGFEIYGIAPSSASPTQSGAEGYANGDADSQGPAERQRLMRAMTYEREWLEAEQTRQQTRQDMRQQYISQPQQSQKHQEQGHAHDYEQDSEHASTPGGSQQQQQQQQSWHKHQRSMTMPTTVAESLAGHFRSEHDAVEAPQQSPPLPQRVRKSLRNRLSRLLGGGTGGGGGNSRSAPASAVHHGHGHHAHASGERHQPLVTAT